MLKDVTKSQSSRPRRSPSAIALCMVALAVCVAGDLGSKVWALNTLSRPALSSPGPVCAPADGGFVYFQRVPQPALVLIDGYLELRYAENCGAAFGVLNHGPAWLRLALFAPAAIAAALGLIWLFVTGYGGTLFAISVPLIASGAIGNLADRFRLGYVVDFIRFHVHEGFVYPTFNIADSTITVGVVLLLIEGFIAPRVSNESPAEAGASAAAKTPR